MHDPITKKTTKHAESATITGDAAPPLNFFVALSILA
jgi:hypothetical protein